MLEKTSPRGEPKNTQTFYFSTSPPIKQKSPFHGLKVAFQYKEEVYQSVPSKP